MASADSSAELMYIARETLVSLVEDYPELGQNIAKYVFDRYHAGKNDIEPVRSPLSFFFWKLLAPRQLGTLC